MADINLSEHNRLSQQFNEAKQLYERMVLRKGHWFKNRDRAGYYSDHQTIADLETSLHILDELQETLNRKPDRNEWLLHIAGVHWQRALALFYLGKYEEAASENAEMKKLIPIVPSYLWRPNQEEEYWSDYYFLEGELALVKGNTQHAIQSFKQSREIDIRLRNAEGVFKCNYYLRILGALPPKRPNLKKFFLGKGAFLIVAFGSLVLLSKWVGIDVWKPSGAKGIGLLIFNIFVGVLADRIVRHLIFDPNE